MGSGKQRRPTLVQQYGNNVKSVAIATLCAQCVVGPCHANVWAIIHVHVHPVGVYTCSMPMGHCPNDTMKCPAARRAKATDERLHAACLTTFGLGKPSTLRVSFRIDSRTLHPYGEVNCGMIRHAACARFDYHTSIRAVLS